jgi:hypothetical protein
MKLDDLRYPADGKKILVMEANLVFILMLQLWLEPKKNLFYTTSQTTNLF